MIDSRLECVRLAEQGRVSMTELCRRFGISRATGYQRLRRSTGDSTRRRDRV